MRRRKRSERAGELGGLSAAASALLPPSFAFFPLHALGFLPSFLPSPHSLDAPLLASQERAASRAALPNQEHRARRGGGSSYELGAAATGEVASCCLGEEEEEEVRFQRGKRRGEQKGGGGEVRGKRRWRWRASSAIQPSS